jgi:hypothetical protein
MNARVVEQRRVTVELKAPNDGGCATAAPAAFIAGYMGGEPPTMGLHLPLIYEPRGN